MDLNSFLEVVKDNMQYLVGDEAKVEIKEISKNNGKLYHSITVHDKKSNCAPSMYLDEMFENYKRGMSIEEIIVVSMAILICLFSLTMRESLKKLLSSSSIMTRMCSSLRACRIADMKILQSVITARSLIRGLETVIF